MNSVIENQKENIIINSNVPFVYDRIPPMTDPLGKYWDQPDMTKILINDHYALMNRKSFEELLDYSNSQPTGVYTGKCFKKFFIDPSPPGEGWYLCWFEDHATNPNVCANRYRKIILTDNYELV